MKNNNDYQLMECKSAIHKVSGRFPYRHDLNIYRGCSHGCKYCFALYSHSYMESSGFFDEIYVKKNIAEVLEKELASKAWKHAPINIGGVTDSYQSAEEHFKLMPDILNLLIKYKTPAIISTKSDLILRDFDLVAKLARLVPVNIAATITTFDENVRCKIEPGAKPSSARFEMLREFKNTDVETGVHMMPVLPFITDSYENIDAIFAKTKEIGIDYILPGMLNLRGPTRGYFFSFLEKEYPEISPKMAKLYESGRLDREFSARTHRMISELRQKYHLSYHYRTASPAKQSPQYEQLSLFSRRGA